jgi:hypothetical protein
MFVNLLNKLVPSYEEFRAALIRLRIGIKAPTALLNQPPAPSPSLTRSPVPPNRRGSCSKMVPLSKSTHSHYSNPKVSFQASIPASHIKCCKPLNPLNCKAVKYSNFFSSEICGIPPMQHEKFSRLNCRWNLIPDWPFFMALKNASSPYPFGATTLILWITTLISHTILRRQESFNL